MKIENPKSASIYIKLFLAHSGNTLTTSLLPKRSAVTEIFNSGLDMTDTMNPYGYIISITLTTFRILLRWIEFLFFGGQPGFCLATCRWHLARFSVSSWRRIPIGVHHKIVKNSGSHIFPSSWNDMEVASPCPCQTTRCWVWLFVFCPEDSEALKMVVLLRLERARDLFEQAVEKAWKAWKLEGLMLALSH